MQKQQAENAYNFTETRIFLYFCSLFCYDYTFVLPYGQFNFSNCLVNLFFILHYSDITFIIFEAEKTQKFNSLYIKNCFTQIKCIIAICHKEVKNTNMQ